MEDKDWIKTKFELDFKKIKKEYFKLNLQLYGFMLFLILFTMIFIYYVDNKWKEDEKIVEHTKTTSFNNCMKTYKKDYIKNQGTFTLMQERKLNQNLEKININGSYGSALSFGSGEINTSYINKIYEPTEFEKKNNWINNCRKQKQVSKQVDLILKK